MRILQTLQCHTLSGVFQGKPIQGPGLPNFYLTAFFFFSSQVMLLLISIIL